MHPPSLTDLTDYLAQNEAEQELNRADLAAETGDTTQLVAWARKWGRPAIEALREYDAQAEKDADRIAELRADDFAEAVAR